MQAVEPPGARLDGLHATEVTSTTAGAEGGVKGTFTVRELPLKVAESVTLWLVVTVAAAAVKVAAVEPAATVTEDGTVRLPLPLLRVTVEPPAGAPALSVTVQFALPGVMIEAGLHPSELKLTAGVTLMLLPVPLTLRVKPLGSTPSVPITPMLVVPDARVTVMLAVATTPSPIAVALKPDATHV